MSPKPYYEQDGITIYHGDCREVLPSIERADMVFMDPPYGVGLQYGSSFVDASGSDYNNMVLFVLGEARRVAPVVLVTPGMRHFWLYPKATWMLGWFKPGSTRRSDLGVFNEWEPVLVYGKPKIWNDAKRLPDCVNHASFDGDHPCPKPMNLLQWLVDKATEQGQVVVDPFLGSGTTLVAAKNLGRKAIGIEIEERYCEIAAERLSQQVLAL